MPAANRRISSAAVAKATGKSWEDWYALLDAAGCAAQTHQEIVRVVRTHGVSPWWEQMVTVGYEFERGKRGTGKTMAAGFEVGAQQTFAMKPETVWKRLIQRPFRDQWLGTLPRLAFRKGIAFATAEGTRGEIRSVRAGESVRLTWQPTGRKQPTTLQIHVVPAGKGTSLRIHQEKLASAAERSRMRAHWRQVLERFASD